MFAAVHVVNAFEKLPQLARAFSPLIELTSPDTVTFEIDGLRRMLGGPHRIASEIARRAEEMKLAGNIGIAATPESAILAARNLLGVTVIPPGSEIDYFADLPLSALAMSEEMRDLMERWGVHTVEDFCLLPEAGVMERLGEEGRRLLRMARGDSNRPLLTTRIAVNYEERIDLDHPVHLLEPLLFVISRLLNELCSRLQTHGRATTEVHLSMPLEGGGEHTAAVRLPFATHDAKSLLKLIQLELETRSPKKAVVALGMRVTPVDPRAIQNNLYEPPSPQPEKLELTLGRIRALVGVENAGFPRVLNTHRPDSWRMRLLTPPAPRKVVDPVPGARMGFRYFRPARDARVELAGTTPRRVVSASVSGTVEKAAGPWRISGDWWTAGGYTREEWDVALSDGVLYRLYRTRQVWYLEGVYD